MLRSRQLRSWHFPTSYLKKCNGTPLKFRLVNSEKLHLPDFTEKQLSDITPLGRHHGALDPVALRPVSPLLEYCLLDSEIE